MQPRRGSSARTDDEIVFGPNMTTLNFALSRTVGREVRAGRRDPRHAARPRRQRVSVARARARQGAGRRFVDIEEDCTLDLSDLERQLSDRTRIVAFPLASNAVGTVSDAPRIAELAHEVGALAWADAVHFAPHGRIDVAALGVDVLVCSPYKFFGPHLGIAYARAELMRQWRPYRSARVRRRRSATASRPGRSRSSSSPGWWRRSSTWSRSAGTRSSAGSARSGNGSSTGSPAPAGCTVCRRWRVAFRPSRSPSTACRPARSRRGSASAALRSGTATTTRSRS